MTCPEATVYPPQPFSGVLLSLGSTVGTMHVSKDHQAVSDIQNSYLWLFHRLSSRTQEVITCRLLDKQITFHAFRIYFESFEAKGLFQLLVESLG